MVIIVPNVNFSGVHPIFPITSPVNSHTKSNVQTSFSKLCIMETKNVYSLVDL